MIKLSKPSIENEEIEAVKNVLLSGQLVHGEECTLFEKELTEYLNCEDVVLVSSCTAALHLSLIALGIGKGDAVIVPAFTFPATVNAVELVGARPILVDVSLNTYDIDVTKIEATIKDWHGSEKIKAIIPVHEFGCPADMSEIMRIADKYSLLVIEDAACALGSEYNGKKIGTFGVTGCFSFHPRKAITTGEGGAIAVNNKKLAEELRILKNHGIKYVDNGADFVLPGYNYRMTNFQAALGRTQLKKFDNWLNIRKNLQKVYRENLQQKNFYKLPKDVKGHSWQTFMICLDEKFDRNAIINKLRINNIETNLGAQAINCLAFYQKRYNYKDVDYPNAAYLYKYGLALPLCQEMHIDNILEVIDKVNFVLKNKIIY